MKETFYFRHDYNAHDDNKLKKVIRKHGATGFGIYWYLIEILYQESGAWYLPKDYEDYAFDLRTDSDRIKSVVEDFGLFEFNETDFWNKRVDNQIQFRIEKSNKAKKSAKLRWSKGAKGKGKVDSDMHSDMHSHSEGNARKGKERKEKDNKTNEKEEVKIKEYEPTEARLKKVEEFLKNFGGGSCPKTAPTAFRKIVENLEKHSKKKGVMKYKEDTDIVLDMMVNAAKQERRERERDGKTDYWWGLPRWINEKQWLNYEMKEVKKLPIPLNVSGWFGTEPCAEFIDQFRELGETQAAMMEVYGREHGAFFVQLADYNNYLKKQ